MSNTTLLITLVALHVASLSVQLYTLWLCFVFYKRDQSRKELVDALEQAFLRRQSKHSGLGDAG